MVAYLLGFVFAQYLGLWFIRELFSETELNPFGGPLTLRFIGISVIEALAALVALIGGISVEVAPFGYPKRWVPVAAFALGIVVSLATVGPAPLVPRITDGDAQLLLSAVAAVVLSFGAGLLLSRGLGKVREQ